MECDTKTKTPESSNHLKENTRLASCLNDELDTVACDCLEPANSTKTVRAPQNATNFHPLMLSPVSQDFPDLIPETQRTKVFKPHSQSTPLSERGTETDVSLETKLNRVLSNYSYGDQIPGIVILAISLNIFNSYTVFVDFAESPSVLKSALPFDLPVELSSTDLSDTENDRSVYEAHLNCNLQNVSLTLNQKEGIFVQFGNI